MHSDIEAGVRIADFKIIKTLGSGGMGIVYLAKQVSLNRLVALKVLGPTIDDRRARARFKRESQAVALLNHPGIAAVYYTGQDDKLCYMAMEYIDGQTLRQVFKRLAAAQDATITLDSVLQHPPDDKVEEREIRFDIASSESDELIILSENGDADPPSPAAEHIIISSNYIKRCCEIVRDAAFALEHAHKNGVVHRDVKPENLMLHQKDGVHVIDFGVARFRDDISISHTGAQVGTPMYMSPEQIAARVNIDHRSDIFSLGIVLYEALTLRPPYSAQTREGILLQIVTKAMPPVRVRNQAVSRQLEAIVHKAIAKDPEERYSSAEAFAHDLQHLLNGKPITARAYRYKLDNREIAAERPLSVIIVTFVMGFWGAVFLLLMLFGVNDEKSSPNIITIGDIVTWIFLRIVIILSIWTLWTARGLLLGKRMSILAATVINLLVSIGLCLARFTPPRHTPTKTDNLLFYTFMGCFFLNMVILHNPRTRRWFRLARAFRSEHARHKRAQR